MIRTSNKDNRGSEFLISEHKMLCNEKTIELGHNLSSPPSAIVPSVDPIVGVEVNQALIVYVLLKERIFLREHVPISSFVLKGDNEIEISTKDINGMVLVLDELVEEIEKGIFLTRELGAINIG